MDGKRGATIGAAIIAGAVALVLVQQRQAAMRAEYVRNARAQTERVARQAPPAPSAEQLTWAWVGGEAWPRLSTVNDACGALHRCNDVAGPARASCLEPLFARCELALDELAAMPMREDADGLFLWRLAWDRSHLCAYRVNLRALREQPEAFARLRAGASTEEAIGEAADRGRPRALVAYDAELEACAVDEEGLDLGETDRYLRRHFGCEQVRSDGLRGMALCCTAERVGRMHAAGIEARAPDPSCP